MSIDPRRLLLEFIIIAGATELCPPTRCTDLKIFSRFPGTVLFPDSLLLRKLVLVNFKDSFTTISSLVCYDDTSSYLRNWSTKLNFLKINHSYVKNKSWLIL